MYTSERMQKMCTRNLRIGSAIFLTSAMVDDDQNLWYELENVYTSDQWKNDLAESAEAKMSKLGVQPLQGPDLVIW